jgi:hypothetical protein
MLADSAFGRKDEISDAKRNNAVDKTFDHIMKNFIYHILFEKKYQAE